MLPVCLAPRAKAPAHELSLNAHGSPKFLQTPRGWKVLTLTRNWGLPSAVSLMAEKPSSLAPPMRSRRKSRQCWGVCVGDPEPAPGICATQE